MKKNSIITLRMKIYVFIVIVSFFMGWTHKEKIVEGFVHNHLNVHYLFDYKSFAACLLLGYGLTLLYDIITYYKKRDNVSS
ncbi:MAG: hypothetical protein V4581_07240 [Bacteroidota bacterium]